MGHAIGDSADIAAGVDWAAEQRVQQDSSTGQKTRPIRKRGSGTQPQVRDEMKSAVIPTIFATWTMDTSRTIGKVLVCVIGTVLVVACNGSGPADVANPAEASALQASAVDLIPGVVRTSGCVGPNRARLATGIELELWLELGPYIAQPFREEFLIEIDGVDVARVPIVLDTASPGQRVKFPVPIYLPRNLAAGPVDIRGGFLPPAAPGESRRLMPERLAPLWSLVLEAATPTPRLTDSETEALLAKQRRAGENPLLNGGFEQGLQGWEIDDAILTGRDGWNRSIHVTTDDHVALEGRRSLRIDFSGGQDPNFWHVSQDIPVTPDTDYVLSYFVRTESITSKSGPIVSLESIDGSSEAYFVATPPDARLVGTADWTYVEIPFHSRPIGQSMRLRIRRSGSGLDRYAPDQYGVIQGSVWYDGFNLALAPD